MPSLHHSMIGKLLAVCLALIAFATQPPTAQAREAHLLGPEDKLSLKILEWRPGEGEYFEWEAVGGAYSVSASGGLSVPLLGNIEVSGLTVEQAAQLISGRMRERVGLAQLPIVSLQIDEYRPVYVLGDVASSGAYPFRPGLTVLQTVALAGGYPDDRRDGSARLRQSIQTGGQHEALRLELRRAKLRRARLRAELDGGQTVEMPADVADDAVSRGLLTVEQAVMDARREEATAAAETILRQKFYAVQEIEVLGKQRVLLERELELLTSEREKTDQLVQRQLMRSGQAVLAETRLTNTQRELLELTRSVFRAQQEAARLDQLTGELESERRAAIRLDLQETDARIEQVKTRIVTASAVFASTIGLEVNAGAEPADTNSIASAFRSMIEEPAPVKPVFSIKRQRIDSEPELLQASEDTYVRPGDVVKVTLVPIEAEDAATQ